MNTQKMDGKMLLKDIAQKCWEAIRGFFLSRKGSNTINTSVSGLQYNSGTVYINNINGEQTNNYQLDPIYHCGIYKGDRICTVCYPNKVLSLTKANLGNIQHLRCDVCSKVYHQQT